MEVEALIRRMLLCLGHNRRFCYLFSGGTYLNIFFLKATNCMNIKHLLKGYIASQNNDVILNFFFDFLVQILIPGTSVS